MAEQSEEVERQQRSLDTSNKIKSELVSAIELSCWAQNNCQFVELKDGLLTLTMADGRRFRIGVWELP